MERLMDNIRFRVIFDLGRKKRNVREKHNKISKTAKFGCEML